MYSVTWLIRMQYRHLHSSVCLIFQTFYSGFLFCGSGTGLEWLVSFGKCVPLGCGRDKPESKFEERKKKFVGKSPQNSSQNSRRNSPQHSFQTLFQLSRFPTLSFAHSKTNIQRRPPSIGFHDNFKWIVTCLECNLPKEWEGELFSMKIEGKTTS